MTFQQWIAKVDERLIKVFGMPHDCLPDCDYYSWWSSKLTPSVAARMAIENAKNS